MSDVDENDISDDERRKDDMKMALIAKFRALGVAMCMKGKVLAEHI